MPPGRVEMRSHGSSTLALLVGLVIAVLGVLGFIMPETFLIIGRHSATPVGLWIVACVRVGIGLVLVRAAPSSRSPTGLRVLGAFSFLSGVATPFVGVERARTYLDWWAARGDGVMRVWALVAIAFGIFVAFAVTNGHRVAVRRARSAV